VPGRALDLTRDRAEALDALRPAIKSAMHDHASDVVIIGGAALSGLAGTLQAEFSVRLIDSLAAAVAQSLALAALDFAQPRADDYAPIAVEDSARREISPRSPT
jgi:Asp/Glu/hydantoin racemase